MALITNPIGGKAGTSSAVVTSTQGVAGGVPVAISEPGLSGGVLQRVTTVGIIALTVPAAPLAGRATMLIQNVGATTIYLGSPTVTADTAATGGLQLLSGQSIPISLSSAVLLYAISSAAGGLVMTFEIAA
jgi:hypothetical protein